MMGKKGQFNFAWIFAIIVGGAILFLAIYGALQTGDVKRFQSDTEVAKSISILTDPLQAGFAEGSFGRISFNQETRINNICFSEGFGKNDISVSTKSNIGEEWNLPGGATSIHNKYLFSSEKNTGKDYYVFSKGFEFPYKVSDLVFITPENYCFFNSPKEVIEDIEGLNIPNIQLAESKEDCTLINPIKVCFDGGINCEINVYGTCTSGCNSKFDEGRVSKSQDQVNYVGNLMYAAIFSEEQIYKCNVQRLFYRSEKVAEELIQKIDLMDARGCDSNLKIELLSWRTYLTNASQNDLIMLNSISKKIDKKNSKEFCGLW